MGGHTNRTPILLLVLLRVGVSVIVDDLFV